MKKKILLVVLLLGYFIRPGNAQNEKFKALFIFNFTKHIEWRGGNPSEDFVIAVYGNSEVIDALQTIAKTKAVGNKKIKVVKVTSPDDLPDCKILYLPPSKSNRLDDVLPHYQKGQTLIVTDKPGLSQKGASINLIEVNGKQKFEISKSNIEKQGLKVTSSLLSLGIEV
ncbi:YfiR family protein [Marinilabiliaceae bacterium JC017]|nr:YfiR family protein [Marinilabiliaceae bacterium JC017]